MKELTLSQDGSCGGSVNSAPFFFFPFFGIAPLGYLKGSASLPAVAFPPRLSAGCKRSMTAV